VTHACVGREGGVCLWVVQAVGVSQDVERVRNLEGVRVLLLEDAHHALAAHDELALHLEGGILAALDVGVQV